MHEWLSKDTAVFQIEFSGKIFFQPELVIGLHSLKYGNYIRIDSGQLYYMS
jgi:hypothetical protein